MTSQVFDAATNSPWAGTETTGASAYGLATVTGAGGIAPSGQVTYNLFTSNDCTGTSATLNTPNLGTHSVATPALDAGTYSLQAKYLGDANYLVASGCQSFTVSKPTPSLTVAVNDASTNQPWSGDEGGGASAYATTSLTGLASGASPTGSITYSLFSNGSCIGTPASQNTVSVGSNSATASNLAAGFYSYQAAYAGDANYNGAKSICQKFTVDGPPTALITAPGTGGSYALGQSVPTSFACADPVGRGIASCLDSNGAAAGAGKLDTASPGAHTYTVTATSKDGQTGETIITYVVADNNFTVTRVTHPHPGIFKLWISLPGPGVINVLESAKQPGRLAKVAHLLQPAAGRFTVARARKAASGAGVLTIRIARSARMPPLAAVRLFVTFTPTGGVGRTQQVHSLR